MQPGDRVRLKAPFFEIETGTPTPTSAGTDSKIPEQRPPAADAPKLADSDPPS